MSGAAMSWTNSAANDAERASVAVRWSVRWRQHLGFKQDHAFEDAGDALGLSQRYVRGVVRDEIFGPLAARWRLIRHRWWADCDRQAAEFRALADEIIRKKEADQLGASQLTLPLGDSAACSDYSRRRSSCGDGGAQ